LNDIINCRALETQALRERQLIQTTPYYGASYA